MATAATNTKNHRFVDINEEPRKLLQPIEGYKDLPLVTLEEAIEPIVDICPDVRRRAYIAKGNCEELHGDLPPDEAAAIYLYTSEWGPRDECLYVALNTVLRSKDRRTLLPAWLLYLKLLLTGLFKLKPFSGTVWRGVPLDLQQQYEVGKTYTWWGFSSCTETLPVLKSDAFLGEEGKRTVFSVKCFNGRKIRSFSSIEEEEEILLLPATQFVVISKCQLSKKDPDLFVIEIQQVEPPYELLENPNGTSTSSKTDKPKPNKPTIEKKPSTPLPPPPQPKPIPPPKKEYKEFADPGTYDKLFCEGRACAKCHECRDWRFTGDRDTWNWLANYKNWKKSDEDRYRKGNFYKLFTKRDDATCGHYGGLGHYLYYGHLGGGHLGCFCEDHFSGK